MGWYVASSHLDPISPAMWQDRHVGGLGVSVATTGGRFLQAFPVRVLTIIRPERARYFAKAHRHFTKTDAIDAGILTRFARDLAVPIVRLPPDELSVAGAGQIGEVGAERCPC